MHVPVLGSLPLDLKGRIDAILAKARGPVALAGFDRLTGAAWALDGDRPFQAGQLSALSLLMHAFERAQRGDLDLGCQRPSVLRTVTECNGEAIAQLSERLGVPAAETVTACGVLEGLASLEGDHPLWDLLAWEGDRTKFPRRLPDVPIAYKAADRCEPQLAHGAGRVGGAEGVLLVILTEGDAVANSLIGRIVKAVWEHRQEQLARQNGLSKRLDALRARHLPDRRLGLLEVRPVWKDGALVVEGETTLPQAVWAGWEDASAVLTLHGEPARVSAPVLNLRREPRHGSELVSQAPMGTALTVLKRPEGEWWRVQSPDGYVAWARSENLRAESHRLGAVGGKSLSEDGLRTLPVVLAAERRDGMGTLPLAAGSELRLREHCPEGYWAETPQGIMVWVPEGAAIARADRAALWRRPSELGRRAVAIAEAWVGIPYLWGGKSGWGLDCSGLTQLAYELLGVRLPRDADQQARAVPAVSRWEDLEPGDLLFYPGHVALWAGAGSVIHASSPRGGVVREDVARVIWLRERCTGMGRPVGALPVEGH